MIATKQDETMQIPHDFIEHLFNLVDEGNIAEKKIISFRNFFLTSLNPSNHLPEDAGSVKRAPAANPTHEFIHPCQQNKVILQASNGDLTTEAVQFHYCDLISHCQRHRHNSGYCQKDDGTCRFGFPRDIQCKTHLIVKDITYSRGEKKGQLKNTVCELTFHCNDRWLNSHSKFGLLTWAANLDMSILIDNSTTINYVAKYCTKVERASVALTSLVREGIKRSRDEGISESSKKVLRRTFNKLTGRRDKCTMEICHLALSNSMVVCDHAFENVNFFGSYELNFDEDSESIVKKLSQELYGDRLKENSWANVQFLRRERESIKNYSFIEFLEKFYVKKSKIYSRKVRNGKPGIIMVSPEVCRFCDSQSEKYYLYCLINLLKHVPWEGNMASVYQSNESFPTSYDSFTEEEKEDIMLAFYEKFRLPQSPYFMKDDPLHRAVSSAIRDPDFTHSSMGSQFSFESDLNELDEALQHKTHHEEDDDDAIK